MQAQTDLSFCMYRSDVCGRGYMHVGSTFVAAINWHLYAKITFLFVHPLQTLTGLSGNRFDVKVRFVSQSRLEAIKQMP